MTPYERARDFAKLMLRQDQESGTAITSEAIQRVVSEAADLDRVGKLTAAELEKLLHELESYYQHTIGRSSALVGEDDDWAPWLADRRGAMDWPFWARYRIYLETLGFNDAVLGRLASATDEVLNYLGNPLKEGRWDRRGLAVGLVQSGKTAHYIGVINKAIDAGYKLIVVITGFTESLRVQTQLRVDNGALGYWLRRDPDNPADLQRILTGVGLIPSTATAQPPDSVTSRRDDFRRAVVRNLGIHVGGNPIVFVVKKNATVLRHLLAWAKNFGGGLEDTSGVTYVQDVPLLVIDDESDVGSIDTRAGGIGLGGDPEPDHDPSTINKQIRKLLTLFDQSSYIGYTATPFANVLIHNQLEAGLDRGLRIGKDLFPRSFIVSLPSPTNHIGPSIIFGTDRHDAEEEENEELPILRDITDSEIGTSPDDFWMPGSHKKGHSPRYENKDEIPPSLKEAILSFIIACATRNLRGDHTEHNSMLVHVTRFIDVQGRVLSQIDDYLQNTVSRLRNSTADKDLRAGLKQLWQEDFIPTTEQICSREGLLFQNTVHSWSEIEPHILQAAGSIGIRAINGESDEVLDYEVHNTGLNVIAVGGDKLSRGLTLEGLSVSYFLRSSKMYDTLMQMGRWFGYRPRYLDLCRLYTTPQMRGWFAHISDATQELRDEFEVMKHLGRTPEEFGLRVRSHPTMMVTSRVKMRYATEIKVSFQAENPQTLSFSRKAKTVKGNWKVAERLITVINEDVEVFSDEALTWLNVKPEAVIDFLTEYKNSVHATNARPELLRKYIVAEGKEDRLTRWVVKISAGRSKQQWSLGPHNGRCAIRRWKGDPDELKKDDHYKTGILTDPSDEAAGLQGEQIEAARDAYRKYQEERGDKSGNRPGSASGRFYRMQRDKKEGVLILYPLDPGNGKGETTAFPILGFCISFPRVEEKQASRVSYVANPIYDREEDY